MPSVQKTSISDPLRPRPLNASTLTVTPVRLGRLAARFDDCSEDICLTELVAIATDAAAIFNANKFPLPSDSDDEDAGANPDPLKFLLAILHVFCRICLMVRPLRSTYQPQGQKPWSI